FNNAPISAPPPLRPLPSSPPSQPSLSRPPPPTSVMTPTAPLPPPRPPSPRPPNNPIPPPPPPSPATKPLTPTPPPPSPLPSPPLLPPLARLSPPPPSRRPKSPSPRPPSPRPPSPQPPPTQLWATAATSDVPAQAAKVVGPPNAAVLAVTTCARPAPQLGWAPSSRRASVRVLDVSFASTNTCNVKSMGVYFLNLGSLRPVVTTVYLLIDTPPAAAAAGDRTSKLVPVYQVDTSSNNSFAYTCPGLTYFPITWTASSYAGLSHSDFTRSTVVGARLEFNSHAVLEITGLPFLAAVGLFLI
ncbi:hypothetical protein Vafri_1233, partial [Volvox africanus]